MSNTDNTEVLNQMNITIGEDDLPKFENNNNEEDKEGEENEKPEGLES